MLKSERKREVGLVVPAKFTAFTQELKSNPSRYTHFELKNITFQF